MDLRYDSFELGKVARRLDGLATALVWVLMPAFLAAAIGLSAAVSSHGSDAGAWFTFLVAGPIAILGPLTLAAALHLFARLALCAVQIEENTRNAAVATQNAAEASS